MHLVGFIIRIYHDARSSEYQKLTANLQLSMSLQIQCNITSPCIKYLFIIPALSNVTLY